jgi:hypothetical protein
MDILKEIEQQINSIKKVDNSNYLDSIYTHIDRAEFYYKQGKTDNNYFNDVIYRSNQAYEGALKESYKVLADKIQEEVLRKSPNEIEKYFETHSVFRDRVLQLFKNYRQEWRNKSTHDYKLFFDESEAFIALTSVTSFVHLLLKQIQEKIAFNEQQKKLETEKDSINKLKSIASAKHKTPLERLTDVILEFSRENGPKIFIDSADIREVQIMGLFHAYLASLDGNIHIQREPKIHAGGIDLRPDFLIKVDNEPIILEFKRMKVTSGSFLQATVNQVLTYMVATNTFKGIIYYANFIEPHPEIRVEKHTITLNDKDYDITVIKC